MFLVILGYYEVLNTKEVYSIRLVPLSMWWIMKAIMVQPMTWDR